MLYKANYILSWTNSIKVNLENIINTVNESKCVSSQKNYTFSGSAERGYWGGIFLAFVHLKIRITPFTQSYEQDAMRIAPKAMQFCKHVLGSYRNSYPSSHNFVCILHGRVF